MVNCGLPELVLVAVADLAHGVVVQAMLAGGVAVTVLTMSPVAEGVAAPVMTIPIAEPEGNLTLLRLILFPVPLVFTVEPLQAAPALPAQVQVLTLTVDGTVCHVDAAHIARAVVLYRDGVVKRLAGKIGPICRLSRSFAYLQVSLGQRSVAVLRRDGVSACGRG